MIGVREKLGRTAVAGTIATALAIGLACADETFVGATVSSEQSLTTRAYVVGNIAYFWVKDDVNSLVIHRDTSDSSLLPVIITQGQNGAVHWLTTTLASTNVMGCHTYENASTNASCEDCCQSCSPCMCVECTVTPAPQPNPGFPYQLSIGPEIFAGGF